MSFEKCDVNGKDVNCQAPKKNMYTYSDLGLDNKGNRILDNGTSRFDNNNNNGQNIESVWAVRNPNIEQAIEESVDKLGGMCRFVVPGEVAVIKANITGGNPNDESTYTNPRVIKKVVDMVKECGGKPIVVDSSMIWTPFESIADATGYTKWAKENGIQLVNLENLPRVKFDFGDFSAIKRTEISQLVASAKKYGTIINVPALKTHLYSGLTVAMKNMYGVLPSADKAKYHARGINEVIVDVNKGLKPDLTIVDGSRGCEGFGPLWCEKIPDYNLIIASSDPVCADAIAADFIGYKRSEVPTLVLAGREGLGDVMCKLPSGVKITPHEKDGNWNKPTQNAIAFVNKISDFALLFPNMVPQFDSIADFFLGELAYNKFTNKHIMKPLWNLLNNISDNFYKSTQEFGKWLNLNPIKRYHIREKILERPLDEK